MEEEWSEIPYVQVFFALRYKPEFCQKCQIDPRVLAIITTKPYSPMESKSTLEPPLGGDGPLQVIQKTPPCLPYSE